MSAGRRGPRPLARAAACLALASLPHLAAAQDDAADETRLERARLHYERGERLFALGKFADALAAYESAYKEAPLAGFIFNIGQCHRNLGDVDAALFSFRSYLRRDPHADNRAAVEALLHELEEEQRQRRARPTATRPFLPDGAGDDDPERGGGRPVPAYRRWWFWTAVVAAAGGVAAGAVLLARGRDGDPTPSDFSPPETGLGNIDYSR